MDNNSIESYPGEKLNSEPSEADLARADEWQSAMNADDVPAFAGDISMNQGNGFPDDSLNVAETADTESYSNKGLTDAAAIINYGLNAAAREYGVEAVVQKIKSFDATGSENPIRDLFIYLGIDTPEEINDVKMEREAVRFKEADFYENSEVAPMTKKRSPEGAFKAIQDMKELITEVEKADPRYEQLRREARAAGKGYFEYAVGSKINRDLTDLFGVLAAEPKPEEKPEETLENPENPENPSENNATEGLI
ncbi:hypothetical protein IKG24_00925 [Candidatus Saccharibacteria bacterium]|nr:hypothetical protein [Candidatus Saccharibacteria bacterium]